jgi:hypothetical protein
MVKMQSWSKITHYEGFDWTHDRWLKILGKMWQTGTRYDAELHARNRLKHGSWVPKTQNA